MLPLLWRPGLLRRIYALSLISGSRNNPRGASWYIKASLLTFCWLCRDKLRLKSLDVEGSGLWLSAIPSEALGLAIPSFEFSLLLRWWLGERLLSTPSVLAPGVEVKLIVLAIMQFLALGLT